VIKKSTTESLIREGIELAKREQRWPVSSDFASDGRFRRAFGTWGNYLLALQAAYTDEFGTALWDTKLPESRTKATILRENVVGMYEAAVVKIGAYPPTKPCLPKHKKGKDAAELHMMISDVHVGEFIDPSLASGLAGPEGYNLAVFHKSADIHEERILFFTEMYRNSWNVEKLVINFLGDIVTGENIFQGQALQIDRIMTEQVLIAANRFASMFYNLSQHFKEVEVFCVPGNHGRIGKKGELHWRSNMDYMTYLFVKEKLRDQKNIKVFVSRSPNMIVQHGNYVWALQHGDLVAGMSATNFVPVERKARALAAAGNINIHFTAAGHVHRAGATSMANGGKIFINGSYPGATMFSVDTCSDAQLPAQKSWLYDPKHGRIFCEADIYLGRRVQLVADQHRIFTPHGESDG